MRSVAYYANDFRGTNASGLTTYVRSMRDALCAREIDVRVLTRVADSADPNAEILAPSHWLRRASNWTTRLSGGRIAPFEESLAIAWRAKTLDDRGCELFEVEEHWGLADLLLRTPLRAPVVVRAHGPHFMVVQVSQLPWDAHAQRMDQRERDVALRADALTVPSRDTLRRIREHWQHDFPHARVIANSTPELPQAQCWAGDSAGPIVFVGRTDRHKGADLAVRAFAQIAAQFPERELWLVGPQRELRDEGRCYAHFADFVAHAIPDASVRARVRVLGAKTPKEVTALRQQASCVIVASRFETFCLAAVEAMMAGCPLIAPDGSALPELIQDNVTGLLFSNDDAHDLARALRLALEQPELARRLGAAARDEALCRFAPHAVVEETLQFYAETVAQAPKEPRLTRALKAVGA
jgi:glycosyltransferase involved in cell wall biosynthesis